METPEGRSLMPLSSRCFIFGWFCWMSTLHHSHMWVVASTVHLGFIMQLHFGGGTTRKSYIIIKSRFLSVLSVGQMLRWMPYLFLFRPKKSDKGVPVFLQCKVFILVYSISYFYFFQFSLFVSPTVGRLACELGEKNCISKLSITHFPFSG